VSLKKKKKKKKNFWYCQINKTIVGLVLPSGSASSYNFQNRFTRAMASAERRLDCNPTNRSNLAMLIWIATSLTVSDFSPAASFNFLQNSCASSLSKVEMYVERSSKQHDFEPNLSKYASSKSKTTFLLSPDTDQNTIVWLAWLVPCQISRNCIAARCQLTNLFLDALFELNLR